MTTITAVKSFIVQAAGGENISAASNSQSLFAKLTDRLSCFTFLAWMLLAAETNFL
jgi:hypothetical protein